MHRVVMMFPGQGAQYYQMGRELLEQDAVFRRTMRLCDDAAGPVDGRAVSDIIYGRPMAESAAFDRLLETNPALLAVCYCVAMCLFDRGVVPDMLLGYSLGEIIAAVVAGIVSLEDGFRLVLDQARLVEAQAAPGAMIAVLGDISLLRQLGSLAAHCEPAALNAPNHFVISLASDHAGPVQAALHRLGATWVRLPVRYPFHSSLLEPVGPAVTDLSPGVAVNSARFAVISSAIAGRVDRFDGAHRWRVLRGPVRFHDTIRALAGADRWTLIDAGPSGTLAGFVRLIAQPGVTAHRSIDQFGQNLKTMQQIGAA